MTDPHRVSIRTAGDLLAALEGDDSALRIAALQAVMRDPAAAWRYGAHEGRDVIDALLDRYRQAVTWEERAVVLQALVPFGDPRVLQLCGSLMQRLARRELLELAAARIGAEPPEVAREMLRGMLMQDGWPVHAAVAARVLEHSTHLTADERIRVACAFGQGVADLPAIDAASAEMWLGELSGPFQDGAHLALEALGVRAFRAMRTLWTRMTTPVATWFIDWGLRSHPDETWTCLVDALRSQPDDLALPVLFALARRPIPSSRVPPLVHRFLRHGDPAARRAALSLGATDAPWTQVAQHDPDPQARLIAIRQLANARDAHHLPLFENLLMDDDWRVRAEATRGIAALGDTAIESARRLALCPRTEVRVAAVQALLSLGEHEWLEAHVIPA
jgi:hypothetical protein